MAPNPRNKFGRSGTARTALARHCKDRSTSKWFRPRLGQPQRAGRQGAGRPCCQTMCKSQEKPRLPIYYYSNLLGTAGPRLLSPTLAAATEADAAAESRAGCCWLPSGNWGVQQQRSAALFDCCCCWRPDAGARNAAALQAPGRCGCFCRLQQVLPQLLTAAAADCSCTLRHTEGGRGRRPSADADLGADGAKGGGAAEAHHHAVARGRAPELSLAFPTAAGVLRVHSAQHALREGRHARHGACARRERRHVSDVPLCSLNGVPAVSDVALHLFPLKTTTSQTDS